MTIWRDAHRATLHMLVKRASEPIIVLNELAYLGGIGTGGRVCDVICVVFDDPGGSSMSRVVMYMMPHTVEPPQHPFMRPPRVYHCVPTPRCVEKAASGPNYRMSSTRRSASASSHGYLGNRSAWTDHSFAGGSSSRRGRVSTRSQRAASLLHVAHRTATTCDYEGFVCLYFASRWSIEHKFKRAVPLCSPCAFTVAAIQAVREASA